MHEHLQSLTYTTTTTWTEENSQKRTVAWCCWLIYNSQLCQRVHLISYTSILLSFLFSLTEQFNCLIASELESVIFRHVIVSCKAEHLSLEVLLVLGDNTSLLLCYQSLSALRSLCVFWKFFDSACDERCSWILNATAYTYHPRYFSYRSTWKFPGVGSISLPLLDFIVSSARVQSGGADCWMGRKHHQRERKWRSVCWCW